MPHQRRTGSRFESIQKLDRNRDANFDKIARKIISGYGRR